MENHLIIVFGGTGGKILREYRKIIHQNHKQNIPSNIQFLYVDSSLDELNKKEQWEVMGESIALGKSSFVELKSDNLSDKFREIENYDGLKEIIGNKQDWIDVVNDSKGQKTAGMQRRRMGAILFASNVREFNAAVADRVAALRNASNITNVNFHLCAGLAGGTGSGAIIGAIAQIRSAYQTKEHDHNILLYTYLPENGNDWNTELDFYHANGYAALTELNALSVGVFKPTDVTGQKGRLNLDTPFTGCYVFTNENENGLTVDKEKELPRIVADFIYQKTIAVQQVESALQRIESGENGDPSPEMMPDSKVPERSKRFLTFGIKRLAIPEQEIKEYLTFSFAKQAALQLRFNNWSDVAGYQNETKNASYHELVRSEENQQRWMLTLKHLSLQVLIIDDESSKKWKDFERHWEDLTNYYKSVVKEVDKNNWIVEVKKLCQKQFDEDFRKSGGVVRFFDAKRKDKRDMARQVRKSIENEFFNEWKTGTYSVYDLDRKLNALIDYLRDEVVRSLDDKIASIEKLEEQAVEKVRDNDVNWDKIGMLSEMMGKRDEIFGAQVLSLKDLWRIRTEKAGYRFSKDFLPEIIEELLLMSQEIGEASALINESLEIFTRNQQSRCNDTELSLENMNADAQVYKMQMVKYYESNRVKSTTQRIERDYQIQASQTAKVRGEIANQLGQDRLSFIEFNARIQKGTFLSILEKTCQDNALNVEKDLSRQERLLGMSIVEKLQKDFDGNQTALQDFIGKLIEFAGCYASFNRNEVTKTGPGTSGIKAKTSLFIILSKRATAEYASFMTSLKSAFEFNRNSNVDIHYLEADASEHQVTFMTVSNLFPIRYITRTEFLKEKYEQRLKKADANRAKMLMHTEDIATKLPNLFTLTAEESEHELMKKRQEAIGNLLLAQGMSLIKEETDANGYRKLALVQIDRFGDETPLFWLETNLQSSWKKLGVDNIEVLSKIVSDTLQSNFTHVDKKAALVANILESIKLMKTQLSEDEYRFFKEQAEVTIKPLEIK